MIGFIILVVAIVSLLISSRLAYVFYKMKRNTKNKKILPLANVMLVKSLLFSVFNLLATAKVILFSLYPEKTILLDTIGWTFGLAFILLLFAGQLYLYWLVEMRNGWH